MLTARVAMRVTVVVVMIPLFPLLCSVAWIGYCVHSGTTLASIPPRVAFGPPAGNVFFGEDTAIGET